MNDDDDEDDNGNNLGSNKLERFDTIDAKGENPLSSYLLNSVAHRTLLQK